MYVGFLVVMEDIDGYRGERQSLAGCLGECVLFCFYLFWGCFVCKSGLGFLESLFGFCFVKIGFGSL